jgi:hypothetical protein
MKLTSLSKTVRTILGTRGYAIGLITLLSTIQGMGMLKIAQAQENPNAGVACTAAYFDDPGYMYNPVTNQQIAAVSKFYRDQYDGKRSERMMAEITTFSAPLGSPMGYVINKVDGKEVSIPPKIKRAIEQGTRIYSKNNRPRVAELNQKYGQYATFGQNITLLPSPKQMREYDKDTYEGFAYIKSLLTPEQKKEQQDQVIAALNGSCSPGSLFKPGRVSFTIDTGTRPELDKIVREDKTGTTLFKL